VYLYVYLFTRGETQIEEKQKLMGEVIHDVIPLPIYVYIYACVYLYIYMFTGGETRVDGLGSKRYDPLTYRCVYICIYLWVYSYVYICLQEEKQQWIDAVVNDVIPFLLRSLNPLETQPTP